MDAYQMTLAAQILREAVVPIVGSGTQRAHVREDSLFF